MLWWRGSSFSAWIAPQIPLPRRAQAAATHFDCRDARTIGIDNSDLRNLSDKTVQSANASPPSAVNLCVLVNKPRMTSERYTPFGIFFSIDIPRQALAKAKICNLVSRVTGQRSLATCVTLFTWASPGSLARKNSRLTAQAHPLVIHSYTRRRGTPTRRAHATARLVTVEARQ